MAIKTSFFGMIAIAAIAAALWEVADYFGADRVLARTYRARLLNRLAADNADLKLAFPNATVCFVPEHSYAPYYAETVMQGHVVYSDGDNSDGYWFALVKDASSSKVWIFMLGLHAFEWRGEKFDCPSTITSTASEQRRIIHIP